MTREVLNSDGVGAVTLIGPGGRPGGRDRALEALLRDLGDAVRSASPSTAITAVLSSVPLQSIPSLACYVAEGRATRLLVRATASAVATTAAGKRTHLALDEQPRLGGTARRRHCRGGARLGRRRREPGPGGVLPRRLATGAGRRGRRGVRRDGHTGVRRGRARPRTVRPRGHRRRSRRRRRTSSTSCTLSRAPSSGVSRPPPSATTWPRVPPTKTTSTGHPPVGPRRRRPHRHRPRCRPRDPPCCCCRHRRAGERGRRPHAGVRTLVLRRSCRPGPP